MVKSGLCGNMKKLKTVRVWMLSLGCPKTLVDSEVILGKLDPKQYRMVETAPEADIAILNTCGFIHDAQEESVDRILQLIELKREKKIKAIAVVGCLVQRFPDAMKKELPEVDAFVGSGDYHKIPEIFERLISGQNPYWIKDPGYLGSSKDKRIPLTPRYSRYVKIAEGCNHACSFCTIPAIRGEYRSRTIPDIVKESRGLVRQGAKELILVGQDTSYFGRDRGSRYLLPELLREMDGIPGIEWIRVLYTYPSCISAELMETIRDSRHICHYLDMPLQHVSDAVLRRMRRGISKKNIVRRIHEFRKVVPDVAIRTAFIVGFPGETEREFREILELMEEIEFDRLGIFTYSPEEGTEAVRLSGAVPEEVKEERLHRAMILQQAISRRINERWIGKTLRVLIEDREEGESGRWVGRSYMDAPEVDGSVFVNSKKALKPGKFYDVTIQSVREYDLAGQV